MSFLLDKMVVSEPGKSRPNANVMRWFAGLVLEQAHVSVVSIGEIAFGAARLSPSIKRAGIERWLAEDVRAVYRDRILPIDERVVLTWAFLKAAAPKTPPVIDSLIAATALTHDLTLVTRNEHDFAALGVRIINPWAA